ncbi:EexN family lipoprotein [Erwiniaceae bacterium BAC15a-03b]|uniref:EexN family lipoprotein n=1 Tax=Winslowiella arboricola TaxID=2978220 RepID=A0A9J6PPV8_9GAMM|nr:EexN family lipoprotein [Winslowiella arboricola]MCU5775266.1 EexN family lipoprotein [Winslowiella arboricola]MCU5780337.1 EexN family lipoprotein [Winslowiella arboricola]
MKKMFIISAVALTLVACNDKVHDEEYFYQNLDEARDVGNKCKAGDITGQNCTNAKAAIYKDNQLNAKVPH